MSRIEETRSRLVRDPEETVLRKIRFELPHHGRTLRGEAWMPPKERRANFPGTEVRPVPAVIFSHGYGGSKNDFAHAARFLAENGIGGVCYTFCGGSVSDIGDFPSSRMSVFTEKEDLIALTEEVSGWEGVDPERIYLFGGSMGGLVSALAAEELRGRVRGMILLYPAFCLADDWRRRFPRLEDIPETLEFWGMTLGRGFFASIHRLRVFEEIGGYARRVLILHGEEDAVVPLACSQRAAGCYPRAELVLFPGEGHGFGAEASRKTEEMTLAFVRGDDGSVCRPAGDDRA